MALCSIRPMEPADEAEVLQMVHGLAAHHGDRAMLTPETLRRDAYNWCSILLAEGGSGLLGYAALVPTAQLQFGVRGMDIHHLFVRLTARGQGVGQGLLASCVREAKAQGCAFITVGTTPQNTKAQQVYQRAGFAARPQAGPRFTLRFEGA